MTQWFAGSLMVLSVVSGTYPETEPRKEPVPRTP
jgi:hypothetical protein